MKKSTLNNYAFIDSQNKFSSLLREFVGKDVDFMNNLKKKLEYRR